MSVQGAYYNWEWGYGGDNGGFGSLQLNFSPSDALAVVSLSNATGDGWCSAGFAQYTNTNSDQPYDLSWGLFGYPPMVRDTSMTSVTAGLSLGPNQTGVMTVLVWYL